MMIGERDTFLGWAKSRDGAASLFMKPFPHYDKLVEVYAKDLATGNKARGPGDVSDIDENEEDSNFDPNKATTQASGECNSQTRGTNNTPTVSKQSKTKSNEFDPLELEFS